MTDDQHRDLVAGPSKGFDNRSQGLDAHLVSNSGFVVTGGVIGDLNVHVNHVELESLTEDPRQTFLNEFRQQALRQAGSTFKLSMLFISAGSVILLLGAALVLLRHGSSAGDTAGLMTGLSGVLVSTCGGAFAVHANRAQLHDRRPARHLFAAGA